MHGWFQLGITILGIRIYIKVFCPKDIGGVGRLKELIQTDTLIGSGQDRLLSIRKTNPQRQFSLPRSMMTKKWALLGKYTMPLLIGKT